MKYLLLLITITSCARVVDAGHARLVSYQKKPHSTYFVVTVLAADSCTEYVSWWNSNCWRCKDAEVPQQWNVLSYSNGKNFIEPIK